MMLITLRTVKQLMKKLRPSIELKKLRMLVIKVLSEPESIFFIGVDVFGFISGFKMGDFLQTKRLIGEKSIAAHRAEIAGKGFVIHYEDKYGTF